MQKINTFYSNRLADYEFVEDLDSRLAYSGNWIHEDGNSDVYWRGNGGYYAYPGEAVSVEYTFVGTRFVIWAPANPNPDLTGANVRLYVDGVEVTGVTQRMSNPDTSVPDNQSWAWYTSPWLPLGRHTFKLTSDTSSAGYIVFDGVQIIRTPQPAFATWTPAASRDFTQNKVIVPGFGNYLPAQNVTVEFWSYVTSLTNAVAFATEDSVYNGSNRFLAHIPYDGGNLYWDFGDINTTGRIHAGITYPVINQWHHYALVSDASTNTMSIYLDGTLYASSSGAGQYVTKNDDLWIGFWTYMNTYYPGRLGELRVWNYVRSAAQISADKNKSFTTAQPGLLACWRLDDNVQIGGQITDRSGNNHHGTLQ